MLVMLRLTPFVAHLMLGMVLNMPEQCSFQDLLFHLLFRPFLTRIFFQEILGLEGSKISWEKKHVSYEEIFRQNFLAQNFLRKFWLGFSWP